ncbi:hypothetical protein ACHAWF_003532 [Thalassiosira exigua]
MKTLLGFLLAAVALRNAESTPSSCLLQYGGQSSRFHTSTIAFCHKRQLMQISLNPHSKELQQAHFPAPSYFPQSRQALFGGSYEDLGSIPYDGDDLQMNHNGDNLIDSIDPVTQQHQASQWRSRHWVVLIDDESAIRLAIGDYLHSMGYKVTACDGPMSFLETMLWSCAWSFLGEEKHESNIPWIEEGQSWRLPDCIISDIRMPGGVDGVQLLELLRCPPQSAESHEKNRKKLKRERQKKGGVKNDYDEKDDYDLLDEIVGKSGRSGVTVKITTPKDQALKLLKVIQDSLNTRNQAHLDQPRESKYPNSLDQIPVILLTAKAMASDRIVGYKAGANGYLPKPFRPDELVEMVDNLMKKQERKRKKWLNELIYNRGGSNEMAISDDLTHDEMKEITKEMSEITQVLQKALKQQYEEKERLEHEKQAEILPEALWMLKMGETNKRTFTKEHIRSILFLCFNITLPKKYFRKEYLLDLLESQSAKYPDKLKQW